MMKNERCWMMMMMYERVYLRPDAAIDCATTMAYAL